MWSAASISRTGWICCAIYCAGLFLPADAATELTAEALKDLPKADVYILGEVHDNPAHHANQTAAVHLLQPKALVFEMLTDAQALKIRPEMMTSESLLGAILEWETSGWPDFSMYFPIFAAAPEALVFGGALPRETVRSAVSEGAATVFGASAGLFGLDETLDDAEQATREAGQMAAHCDAIPESILFGMVEAQRLRDAGLAKATYAAYLETGGPVVVITGNGHARTDWGMPVALASAAPDLTVISLGQLEDPPGPGAPYDYWLVTDAVERGDPCDAFRNR